MKKILILVGQKLSANGICINVIIEELARNDYQVFCLTNQEYGTSRTRIEDGVEIIGIKPRLTYIMTSWGNNHSGIISKLAKIVSSILNKTKLVLSIPTWPLISPIYSLRFYKAARDMYRINKFDCIISVYTQIDMVIAGHFIKRKFPEVKFVPYFLDSLSGGYGPKLFSKNWTINRGLWWERRLLNNADKIIVMKSSQKHHEIYSKSESYYSKMKILDIPLLTPSYNDEIETDLLDKSNINLVYVGSIPCHIRNPKYILEIFKKIKTKNCVFTIIGTNTCPEIIRKAQTESKDKKIVIMKQMPHDDVLRVLNNADVLINIGNNLNSMVPSKIFEYMSIGKPIISTFPIDDEPSIKYLSIYPLSLMIKEDWELLDENVCRVEKFIEEYAGKKVNLDELKEEMYYNTPQAFVEEINEMLRPI